MIADGGADGAAAAAEAVDAVEAAGFTWLAGVAAVNEAGTALGDDPPRAARLAERAMGCAAAVGDEPLASYAQALGLAATGANDEQRLALDSRLAQNPVSGYLIDGWAVATRAGLELPSTREQVIALLGERQTRRDEQKIGVMTWGEVRELVLTG